MLFGGFARSVAVASIVSGSHWYTCQHSLAIRQNLALDAEQLATNHLSMRASLDNTHIVHHASSKACKSTPLHCAEEHNDPCAMSSLVGLVVLAGL